MAFVVINVNVRSDKGSMLIFSCLDRGKIVISYIAILSKFLIKIYNGRNDFRRAGPNFHKLFVFN